MRSHFSWVSSPDTFLDGGRVEMGEYGIGPIHYKGTFEVDGEGLIFPSPEGLSQRVAEDDFAKNRWGISSI